MLFEREFIGTCVEPAGLSIYSCLCGRRIVTNEKKKNATITEIDAEITLRRSHGNVTLNITIRIA